MMGLGSMIGTGVFVSIAIAAGVAGSGVIIAIVLAAVVATCNALSSAQLAANHPVAGGTFEYGYKWINSYAGFTAGWMFLLAKGASAATAALGFAGYLLLGTGAGTDWIVPVALLILAILTAIVLTGLRHSSYFNIIVVSFALLSLLAFVAVGLPQISASNFRPVFTSPAATHEHPVAMLLHATALMFVAYTGYGRIATLGEEVREPRRTIPRAIIVTLAVTALVYIGVAISAVGTVGAERFYQAADAHAAPLEAVARDFDVPVLPWFIAAGAMAAMLGVLINLLLGLSRMVMALGRRRDLPAAVARLNAAQTTPILAVAVVGLGIGALVLIGDVRTTWSFSAFTVLIYYALTNLAALRLTSEERLYPRAISWAGLFGCLSLAFWVEWQIWLSGLLLLGAGLAWHAIAKRLLR